MATPNGEITSCQLSELPNYSLSFCADLSTCNWQLFPQLQVSPQFLSCCLPLQHGHLVCLSVPSPWGSGVCHWLIRMSVVRSSGPPVCMSKCSWAHWHEWLAPLSVWMFVWKGECDLQWFRESRKALCKCKSIYHPMARVNSPFPPQWITPQISPRTPSLCSIHSDWWCSQYCIVFILFTHFNVFTLFIHIPFCSQVRFNSIYKMKHIYNWH